MLEVQKQLKGVFTALITPFRNAEIDFESLDQLIKDQEKQGVDGYVINGTTAESPTLAEDEVVSIFDFVRNAVGPLKPLILGTGSNCTQKTIENNRLAHELGAIAALVVVPYYNKPPQRGLKTHFEVVASAAQLPVILYNVPGRTVTSLSVETIVSLSLHPNIIGIKEASGNIDVAKSLSQSTKDFLLLSGDDGTYAEFLRAGGHGVISVASHLIGNEMKKWTETLALSPQDHLDVSPYNALFKLLGIEANPIPLKMALYQMGVIKSPELRLPLTELDGEHAETMKNELKKLGLLL